MLSFCFVSNRGLSDGRKAAFREWFGNLGEMRSLIPESSKLIVVTTATKVTRVHIFKTLHLGKETTIIEKSPERSNLLYVAKYVKARMPFEHIFGGVLTELQEYGAKTDKTMIYCQTRKQATIIFRTFTAFLGGGLYHGDKKPQNRIVELYHAGTPPSVKEHVVKNLCSDGHIRCLITTVAFGMGVDCKKVRNIYNMGPSKNVESYVQESGRGGRDGMPAVCVLLYNGVLSTYCEQDVKDYCSTDGCRREFLFKPFGVTPETKTPKHDCCDNCAANCECGLDSCGEACVGDFMETLELYKEVSSMTRPVSSEHKETIARELKAYRRNEVRKHIDGLAHLVSCPNVLLELGDFLVEQTVESCHRIFTLQDVLTYVEVWRLEHAAAILQIIGECFGDIDMVLDLDPELMDSDSFMDIDWQQVLEESTQMDISYNVDDDNAMCGSTLLVSADDGNSSSFLEGIAQQLP